MAPSEIGKRICGYEVLGDDSSLAHLRLSVGSAIVTIGQIKNSQPRKNATNTLLQLGFNIPTIVSPKAYVSSSASLGFGTTIGHFAVINSSARVGNNCIINTSSLVEHDAAVGDFCHISTKAVVNGSTSIGNSCFVGSGAIIRVSSYTS